MKRFVALVLALFMIFPFLTACQKPSVEEEKTPDFRNVYWGMSREEVAESQDLEAEVILDDTLYYEVEENGEKVLVFFYFKENKLVRGECIIEMGDKEWSIRVPEMTESYAKFRDQLIGTYGAPLAEDYRVWEDKDPAYINDSDMTNLYHGRLRYLTEWKTETSEMSLELYFKDRDFKYIYLAEQTLPE